MLLEDLIDTKVKQINMKNRIDPSKSTARTEKGALGRGTMAVVNQDKADPHMVKRRTLRASGFWTDTYRAYAEFLIKHKLYDKNPYFPRIYAMKNFTDPDLRNLQQYKLEKLVSYEELENVDELKSICDNMFKLDNTDLRQLNNTDSVSRVHNIICELLRECLVHHAIIKDDALLEAARWLNRFEDERHSPLGDIGYNNTLYRRTKYGLHVVFSDPA